MVTMAKTDNVGLDVIVVGSLLGFEEGLRT